MMIDLVHRHGTRNAGALLIGWFAAARSPARGSTFRTGYCRDQRWRCINKILLEDDLGAEQP